MKRRGDGLDERAMRGGALMWEAWRDGRQIDALPSDCRPGTIEEAYALLALSAAVEAVLPATPAPPLAEAGI